MFDKTNYIIKVKCADCIGLTAKITNVIFNENHNILKLNEFVDEETKTYFFRAEIEGNLNIEKISQILNKQLGDNTIFKIAKREKKKIVVLATKEHHCLSDLLIQNYFNELDAEIQCVISNYEDLSALTKKFDIPYFTIKTTDLSREEHEELIAKKINEFEFDYIVLAKYMRILTPDFVQDFENKIINIHHSFLPAFVGANPYKQAFKRGVKIIGATAHFVNEDLDDGPIIEQQILRIDHQLNWKAMRILGRDVERDVLNTALRKVLEEKVFRHGRKTIVL